MLNIKQYLFLAITAAALFFAYSGAVECALLSRVIACIDGDTIKIQTQQHIRFAGIDTPEKATDQSPAQYYAKEAYQLTKQLTLNRQIRFVPLSYGGKDRYGRLIGEVFLPNGVSVNEQLLKEGHAWFYDHSDLPESMRQRFLRAQRSAINRQAGFWNRILKRPEAHAHFIGNRKSRRFFPIPCTKKFFITPRNSVFLPDMETAFRKGYSPARSCPIWPTAAGAGN